MATKQQLRKRWETEEGQRCVNALMEAVRQKAPIDQFCEIVKNLPFKDEVAPNLDLRGLRFKELLFLRDLDLSEARLDYAVFGGSLVECTMVGTVFDGAEAVNLLLQHNFTRASFINANLKGANFLSSLLNSANFTGAKLQSASFKEAICAGATFTNANLRFALCANTDFRGANLSGADLTEASLGGVRFDTHTQLEGTNLTGAAMDRDLRDFAKRTGAIVQERLGAHELEEFDATTAVLKERNTDGRFTTVLKRMATLREILLHEPMYDWGTHLANEIPPEIMQEVEDAVRDAGSNL